MWRRMRPGWIFLCAALLAGCGAPGEPDSGPPPGAPGVSVLLDARGELSGGTFFDHPWPSDLRLDASGKPQLAGFPRPASNRVVERVLAAASDRGAYSVVPTAYFRFDGAVRRVEPELVVAATPQAEVQLLDIDPRSPGRGALYPALVHTPEPDAYVPEHLVAVGPVPGVVLRPATLHAVVVRRAFGDVTGAPLGVPGALAQLLAGAAPESAGGEGARRLFEPLLETLDALGVPRDEVAAATVFTTADAVAEEAALGAALLERHPTELGAVRLHPSRGVHPEFCELHGSTTVPMFQAGSPPYDTEGGFVLGEDGLPTPQRSEPVPVVITVPRRPMPPGGFPVVVYVHGSGGLSTQGVDRGPITEPGGAPRPGEGPALVVARRGFASFAPAMPLNPERFPGAAPRAYLNTNNLAAYRDTFRQGVLELRMHLRALARLRLPLDVLVGCPGVTLPPGETALRFDVGEVSLMGQSMGAQYATLLGAMEPSVRALFPTGSGGHFGVLASEGTRELPTAVFQLLVGTRARLTPLHPALALLELAWEKVEPVVAAPRVTAAPLSGHAPRDLFVPVAAGDGDFPEPVFDAMALAYGVQQAAPEVWPEMQERLALVGRGGLLTLPVSGNLRVGDTSVTAVVAQYRGDGLADPHTVFSQLEPLKHQYGCFFATRRDRGQAQIVPGIDQTAACP